jgi:hypothetical protein|tara:strand:+ start:344 stop:556 length:213 start_codon:yes stop_codon:yes gene_type:complete
MRSRANLFHSGDRREILIGGPSTRMNLVLRSHALNDPTWSIIISIILLLAGVLYIVVYILGIDEREGGDS